jgi:uncharacterized membrane protein YeaQ/YmgE (transglycosylase-associated protein family)
MNTSTKEIIFFLLIFVMTILSGVIAGTIYDKTKSMPFLTLVLVSLVSSIILYIVFRYSKISENFRLLEITPQKRCDGGLYLSGDNEYCQDKWSTPEGCKDLAMYNCINGHCGVTTNYDGNSDICNNQGLYNGRPLNMVARTPLSNDKWENNTADLPILGPDQPRVL